MFMCFLASELIPGSISERWPIIESKLIPITTEDILIDNLNSVGAETSFALFNAVYIFNV